MRVPDVLSRLDRPRLPCVGRMTMRRSTRFLAVVAGAIALIATGLLSPSTAEARHGHGGWRGHGWHGHGGWRGHGWHGHGRHGHWRHGHWGHGHWGHGWRHAGWHRGWGPGWRHARWHRGWRGGVWGAGFYPAVYARPVFAPPPVFPAAYMPPPPPPMAYGGGYGYQSRSSYRRSSGRRYVKKASQPACVCKCCPETPAAASPPAPSTIPGPVDK